MASPLSNELLASAKFTPASPTFAKPLSDGRAMRFSTLVTKGRPATFSVSGRVVR